MLEKKKRMSKSSFQNTASGRNFFTPLLTLRVVKTTEPKTKASVVVSKKIAKSAVARNRIRRRVYAGLRPILSRSRLGILCAVYPKKEIVSASFRDISGELERAFKEANLLR